MPSDITPLAHYSKLSAFEQQLLQFLSVFYEPAHPTTIVNCLHRLDLKNSRGNRPSPANINHYFSKFEQYGLLGPDRRCPATIVEILSKMAVAAGTFTRYAAVIRAEAPISYYYGKWSTRCWRAVRELRIAIYSENYSLIEESQDFLDSQCRELQMETPPLVQGDDSSL